MTEARRKIQIGDVYTYNCSPGANVYFVITVVGFNGEQGYFRLLTSSGRLDTMQYENLCSDIRLRNYTLLVGF